jgi:glutamine cyclotransferase
VEVVRRMPHPERGFTQGLIAEAGGTVLESVGLYGQSGLRRYRLGLDGIAARTALAADFFGEGICLVGEDVWQLTWRERSAVRWDARTLELRDVVSYNREGWGICATGDEVITSDGTSELVRRDPATLHPRGLIRVRCDGNRVRGLNDLAWSAARVWANVAGTTAIVGIDPATGEVTSVVDARAAAEPARGDPQAIMNGIASLPPPGEFLLTGKGWHWIRHVRLAPARAGTSPSRLLEDDWRLF